MSALEATISLKEEAKARLTFLETLKDALYETRD